MATTTCMFICIAKTQCTTNSQMYISLYMYITLVYKNVQGFIDSLKMKEGRWASKQQPVNKVAATKLWWFGYNFTICVCQWTSDNGLVIICMSHSKLTAPSLTDTK